MFDTQSIRDFLYAESKYEPLTSRQMDTAIDARLAFAETSGPWVRTFRATGPQPDKTTSSSVVAFSPHSGRCPKCGLSKQRHLAYCPYSL